MHKLWFKLRKARVFLGWKTILLSVFHYFIVFFQCYHLVVQKSLMLVIPDDISKFMMYFHDSLIFNSLASKSIAKFYVGSHYMKVFAKIRLLFHKPLHLSHQLLNSLLLPNQFRKLSSSRNFLPFYIHAFTKMDLQDSHKLYKPGE